MNEGLLAPATLSGRTRPMRRLAFGFGRRFFFLLIVGLLWLLPAFWNRTFLYAVGIWDALVLIAWAIDYLTLPKPAQLTVDRCWLSAPALSCRGDVELIVHNQGGVAVRCSATDDVPVELRTAPATLPIAARSGLEGRARYDIRPLQRGDMRVGNIFLRYQSAMELAERWSMADLAQPVRVYPNLEQAKRQTIYLTRARQIELEKRLLRQRGMGREFESLREYREGDEFRDICWSASARRGKLVTKLHQMERSQAVWLVLDCGRLMRARIGELSKLDYAVDAALCLAQLALYSGDRVGLLAYGRQLKHRVGVGRGPAHMREILEQLAVVQPEISEADHLRAAGAILGLQKRRGLVIWLTDLAETSMTPEVVEGASQMLSRHLLLFAVIAQPDLAAMAIRKPADKEQMYESMAALDMVERRELLLARLRERGALAMEIAPRALSTALLNQYLMIKERSLL